MNSIAVATVREVATSQCTLVNGQSPTNCLSLPGHAVAIFAIVGAISLAVFLFVLVCQIKIITKAGYSGWYVLTAFVPVLGIVMFVVFAFAKWPIQTRLENAERGGSPRYVPPQYSPPVPSGQPAAASVPGPGLPPPPVATPIGTNEQGVVYCSWCGKERAVNAQAIHHCGSKDRPAVYCMHCGRPFEAGATNCASCGTPATQLS